MDVYIYIHTHTFVDTANFCSNSFDPAVNCSLERRPTKSGSERRQRSYVWQVTCVAYLCGTCCKYKIRLRTIPQWSGLCLESWAFTVRRGRQLEETKNQKSFESRWMEASSCSFSTETTMGLHRNPDLDISGWNMCSEIHWGEYRTVWGGQAKQSPCGQVLLDNFIMELSAAGRSFSKRSRQRSWRNSRKSGREVSRPRLAQ